MDLKTLNLITNLIIKFTEIQVTLSTWNMLKSTVYLAVHTALTHAHLVQLCGPFVFQFSNNTKLTTKNIDNINPSQEGRVYEKKGPIVQYCRGCLVLLGISSVISTVEVILTEYLLQC